MRGCIAFNKRTMDVQTQPEMRGHGLRWSRAAVWAVLALAVMLRVAIPAGYMPGNVFAGEFMVLCPQGLPPGISESLHTGHGDHGLHGDGSTQSLDADSACPIGSALQATAPPPAAPQSVVALPAGFAVETPEYGVEQTFRAAYRSRAPPCSNGLQPS